MVEFNGVSIQDIAPVGLVNIAISAPKPTVTTRNIPVRDGLIFVRRTFGARACKLQFDIIEPDADKRLWYVQRISDWLSPTTPVVLRFDHLPHCHLMAVCTKGIDATVRDWWETLTIEWTAYDPLFVGGAEKHAEVGSPFTVGGNQSAIWRISQSGATSVTSPRWTHEQSSQYLALSGLVYPYKLEINAERRTIQNATVSLMPQLTLSSRWFSLDPGVNKIVGTGGAAGTIYWRERWV